MCDEKWTQQDLRFWKNKGSKRSKNNKKKGGSISWRSRIFFLQNGQMVDFAEFVLPILAHIISGTKCD